MNTSLYFKSHDPEKFKELAPNIGCMVSNRISLEDKPIRFMVRDEPQDPRDSGWTLFSGFNEDESFTDDPNNFKVFSLNTLANVDESIIPLLTSPIGAAFEKLPGQDNWVKVEE